MENLYIICEKEYTNPEEFLESLLVGNYFNTFTYYNKECTDLQCGARRRSFDDLYVLFKTYFKDITKKQLLKLLFEKVTFYFCTGIRKIVFHRVGYEDIVEDSYNNNLKILKSLIKENILEYATNTHTAKELLDILETD